MKEKINIEELIKKIDLKIAELEKQENPNELLKRALLKKEIINSIDFINDKKIEEIFDVIKNVINN